MEEYILSAQSEGALLTSASTDGVIDEAFTLNSIGNTRNRQASVGEGFSDIIPESSSETEPVVTQADFLDSIETQDYSLIQRISQFTSRSELSDNLTGEISSDVGASPTDSSTKNKAKDKLLSQAVSSATDALLDFKNSPDYLAKMRTAFGSDIEAEEALSVLDSTISGEAEINIEIVDIDNRRTTGAFSEENNTIYLSSRFIERNLANPDKVAKVILEEWGHYFDSALNEFDSVGDEGEIFANLVRGSAFALTALEENDHATLSINGTEVAVEQAAFERTILRANRFYVYQSERGSILVFRRNPRNRLAADIFFRDGRTGRREVVRNVQGINIFGRQFRLVTSPSSSRRLAPDLNGNVRFVSGSLAPLLIVRAPRWFRTQ